MRYALLGLLCAGWLLAGCKTTAPVAPEHDATVPAPKQPPKRVARTRPALFIVGDSTVHNTSPGLVGWGDVIGSYFDTNKLIIENHALPGRSSRTFQTQGWWDRVLAVARPGDYVIIQLGHNDSSPINDTNRSRGTLPGLGLEVTNIVNGLTHEPETVHTYGWYMRKYISDARAKGMTPLLCTSVSRLPQPGKELDTTRHAAWTRELAAEQGVPLIDLNQCTLDRWAGKPIEVVRTNYFASKDTTHFNQTGAELNALCVVEGLQALTNCELKNFLQTNP